MVWGIIKLVMCFAPGSGTSYLLNKQQRCILIRILKSVPEEANFTPLGSRLYFSGFVDRSRERSEREAPGNRLSGPATSVFSRSSGTVPPTSVLLPAPTDPPPTPLGRRPGFSAGSPFARPVRRQSPDALGRTARVRLGVGEAGWE